MGFVVTASIPKVFYYSGETNEKAALVMELMGSNIYQLYRKFGPFSTATLMRIGLQVVN